MIIREQVYISIGTQDQTNRRLYIDIQAQLDKDQVILIEVKGLERSPVHELMELLGQYLIYRTALDYLSIDTPLYIAITKTAHRNIIQHVLGVEMMKRYAVPLLIFDPVSEEIIKWIPAL